MEIDPNALRAGRDRASVLKARLAQVRSRHPCMLVFVLEGNDDLKAYETWIKRVAPGVVWEPLVAKGKKTSLEFRDMLHRDKTGLAVCTCFLVDHDYDGLAGQSEGRDLYVLPAHSIENLLNDESSIEGVLRSEFRIVGDPGERQVLMDMFRKARSEFCELVREDCVVLGASRGSDCGRVDISENCLACLIVEPDGVKWDPSAERRPLVLTEIDVPASSLDAAREFLRARPMELWVRGKYLAKFFRAWGMALLDDSSSGRLRFLPARNEGYSLSGEWNTVGSLAGRSSIPVGLTDFVLYAQSACSRECAESEMAGVDVSRVA